MLVCHSVVVFHFIRRHLIGTAHDAGGAGFLEGERESAHQFLLRRQFPDRVHSFRVEKLTTKDPSEDLVRLFLRIVLRPLGQGTNGILDMHILVDEEPQVGLDLAKIASSSWCHEYVLIDFHIWSRLIDFEITF